MQLKDLDYQYPPELVATEPVRPTRVATVRLDSISRFELGETTISGLMQLFAPDDLLVINRTQVIPARIFAADQDEILFLESTDQIHWDVLFSAKSYKVGDTLNLPGGVQAKLEQKGIPQKISVSQALDPLYFDRFAEMALPPYIQEARGTRHAKIEDKAWYQTAWAEQPGSVAAPTASLHFSNNDLETLKSNGVMVEAITLHVGAGTFLPVRTEDLKDHKMHFEWAEIPQRTLDTIQSVKTKGGRVWALGTTVARTLESYGQGKLDQRPDGGVGGLTDLFIFPPYQYRVVDCLLTNFHQPKSTLLALVAAFAGEEALWATYNWAMNKRFRLFSYGDLSAWIKP